jgi:hypothetical protein
MNCNDYCAKEINTWEYRMSLLAVVAQWRSQGMSNNESREARDRYRRECQIPNANANPTSLSCEGAGNPPLQDFAGAPGDYLCPEKAEDIA